MGYNLNMYLLGMKVCIVIRYTFMYNQNYSHLTRLSHAMWTDYVPDLLEEIREDCVYAWGEVS